MPPHKKPASKPKSEWEKKTWLDKIFSVAEGPDLVTGYDTRKVDPEEAINKTFKRRK